MWLWTIATLVVFLAWYVVAGRTLLKTKPWMDWLYRSRLGEWTELALFEKSETKMWSRLKGVAAALLAILPAIGAINVTPYIEIFPAQHRWWILLVPSIALSIDSVVGEMQRNRTTKPMELVNVSNATALQPEVSQQLAMADMLKEEAVVAVQIAKDEART